MKAVHQTNLKFLYYSISTGSLLEGTIKESVF